MSAWFDRQLLPRICCPVCNGELQPRKPFLLCRACALAYPVEQGVPILLKARAKALRNAEQRELG